jgi:hypothetical protein
LHSQLPKIKTNCIQIKLKSYKQPFWNKDSQKAKRIRDHFFQV